ncbi:MAG: LamG domain-containing protein, partial [Abitibacteriaceae bacterium]|nr:LamG domain-containing protein [Abditibacteriaceae bacterium]
MHHVLTTRFAALPRRLTLFITLSLLVIFRSTLAHAQPVPLIASYNCEPDAGNATRLTDSGPLRIDGKLDKATFVPGKQGQAIHVDNTARVLFDSPIIQKLGTNFSFTFWLRLEQAPQVKTALIFQKGGNTGFQLGVSPQRNLYYHGNWGGGWYDAGAWGGTLPLHQWVHVAWTFQKGGKGRIYMDGQQTGVSDTPFAFYPEDVPLQLGGDTWAGAVDNLHIYASALTPEQVRADMAANGLMVRPASDADLPSFLFPIRMALARFDMPIGFQPYDARRYQTAQRVPGPDATDWPRLTLDGKTPLFQSDTADSIGEVPLLPEGQAHSLFRQPFDHEIKPVNHWLRANEWLWGRKFVYTTDRTARTSSGDYEIWAFPIEIRGPGEHDLQSVHLTLGGQTIYERQEPLRSLTLLLPANLNGASYELWVNGRGPARFNVGLKPVTPGHPEDVPLPVNATVPGNGPTITVRLAARPPAFPNQRAWDDDQKSLASTVSARPTAELNNGTQRYLGLEVPRSPVAIFTASMRAGMSGGHMFNGFHITGFKGTPEEYAAYLKQNGYDWVFEDATPTTLDAKDFPLEHWAAAMQAQGLKFGLNPDIPGNLGILSNPNLAFQSSFLPEWGQPAYRDAQLLAQRFKVFHNFLGLLVGADNAGYVTYWDWAPTIPDRPWGRAYEQFQQGYALKTPVGPAITPSQSVETRGTEREF